MPTYEFICKRCDNRFSLFTTVSGRDKALCPKCGNKELQQIFKGVRIAKSSAFSDFMPSSIPSSGGGCSGGGCGGCSGCN